MTRTERMEKALERASVTLREMAPILASAGYAGCGEICIAAAEAAETAPERPSKVKYPIEGLAIGDAMTIAAPRPFLRGSLYNRAEALGIRIKCNQTNHGLRVTRLA